MIANLFGPDLGIVVIIILVVLVGGSQLPKIARNVGMAGKEFRKAQAEAEEEAEREKAKAAQAERDKAAQVAHQQAASAVSPSLGAGPGPAPLPNGPAAASGDSIQLSRAELDALLKAREEQVRREAGSTPSQ